jgi:nucleoside-diphosphate-sugar epimerase
MHSTRQLPESFLLAIAMWGAMSSILVTGGAGYVGSVLAPRLLDQGHRVRVYDIGYYGFSGLPGHPDLEVIEGDIRETDELERAMQGIECVYNLACISNDPSCDLDEELSRTTNFECFEPMVVAAKRSGVKRFIHASSSSVYGVSDAPQVREDHPLVPISLYNVYKGQSEPILFAHGGDDFVCAAIRPATICGYSPRQRLDLTVNILTAHAVTNRKILVFGGDQRRPNLHIQDMCALYELLLDCPAHLIAGEVFNASCQNHPVSEIAEIVKAVVEREFPEGGEIKIERSESDDPRSYHVNTDKLRDVLGFVPKRTVADAVKDLCDAFRAGALPETLTDDRYYNVRRMTAIGAS